MFRAPRIVTFTLSRVENEESGGVRSSATTRDSRLEARATACESLVFSLAGQREHRRRRRRRRRCSRTSIQPRYRVTCVTNEGTIRKVGILSGSRTAVLRFSGCALPATRDLFEERSPRFPLALSGARARALVENFLHNSYVEWIATVARRRDEEVPRAVSSEERK